MHYIALLISCWIINGSIKFAINSIVHKDKAVSLIGYGGFPSTHTAIASSMLVYSALIHGTSHPVIAPLVLILWLVINDATSLRRRVGEHAIHLNTLAKEKTHRERIGHKSHEILGGLVVGATVGWIFTYLF